MRIYPKYVYNKPFIKFLIFIFLMNSITFLITGEILWLAITVLNCNFAIMNDFIFKKT